MNRINLKIIKVVFITFTLFSFSFSQENIEYNKSKTLAITLNVVTSGGVLYFGHLNADDSDGFLLHSGIGIGGLGIALVSAYNYHNTTIFILSITSYYANLIWSGFTVSDFIENKRKQSQKISLVPTLLNKNVGLGICYSF